jgi:hypothetical protein
MSTRSRKKYFWGVDSCWFGDELGSWTHNLQGLLRGQLNFFLYFYGIILWGNSSHSYNVFRMQKRVLRIMTKSGYRDCCRQLFKNRGFLPFYSQYKFSLTLFVVRNTLLYITNQETHGVNRRYNTDFHFPTVWLTAFKEGACFMGMKIFNHLPSNIKILSNRIELFKPGLKKYLLRQSFYSLEEYFSYSS